MGETIVRFTEDDMVAAQRAWWTGSARYQRVLTIALVTSILYIGIVLVIPFSGPVTFPSIQINPLEIAVAVAAAFALTILIFAISYVLTPWRARRQFREHKLLHDEFHWRWDSEALQISSSAGDARIPWGMFHGWLDGRDTLLLYQSKQMFQMLPRRALKPGDLETIIGYLVAAGVQELKRFGCLGRKAAP